MKKNERIEEFFRMVEDYDKTNISKLGKLVSENHEFIHFLTNEGFFTAPASTKYHGAYKGGLYDHSVAVFKRLNELTNRNYLSWQRKESPFIVGMFHDLCKYDQYKKIGGTVLTLNDVEVSNTTGYYYEYNTDTVLKGHGSKSVMILSQFITLTEEEMLCIRYHMGPYETDDWDEFDKAIRKYETVYYTHAADMLASKVDNI